MDNLYQSQFYKAWANMKTRCFNKKSSDYKRYGNRGIEVCENWLMFDGFKKDMLNLYKTGLTLDRIDNNKGYFKDNCRWVSREIQANNRRSNRVVTINDIKKTLEQWIRFYDLKSSTVRQRIYGYGWSVERALELQ